MFAKRKRTKATKYYRYTPVQLVSMIKSKKSEYDRVAKYPSYKKVSGKTPAQYCRKLEQEVHTIATALRNVTVASIKAKIKTLRTQLARAYGVKVSSSRTCSTAVRRLKAKLTKINSCRSITKLMTICKSLKLSSFKNPKVRATATTATRSTYKRRTTARRKTAARRKTTARTKTAASVSKQSTALKREISKLKQRNTFLRRQVARFRKEAATLQRHYGTLSNKPSWKVVKSKNVGKQVSNIVRFSNALSHAFNRKVG